jgi:biotin transporter BioY
VSLIYASDPIFFAFIAIMVQLTVGYVAGFVAAAFFVGEIHSSDH